MNAMGCDGRAASTARRSQGSLACLRAFLLPAALLAFSGTQAAAQAYVVRVGHVLDLSTMTLQPGVTLVVDNGVVTRRFSGAPPGALPAEATVIDLTRYVVLPGLIDAH